MGHRITKVYTRTGDDGSTGVGGGERVAKDSDQVDVIGEVDELNAVIGCVLAEDLDTQCEQVLNALQHHLFEMGGELAYPEYQSLQREQIVWLESWIDYFNQSLEPLQEFILPQGNRAVAFAHLARTVCRRAERALIRWSRRAEVREELICYLNRLSDLLFVIARTMQDRSAVEVKFWKRDFPVPKAGALDAVGD